MALYVSIFIVYFIWVLKQSIEKHPDVSYIQYRRVDQGLHRLLLCTVYNYLDHSGSLTIWNQCHI